MAIEFELRLSHDWDDQIARIRDQVTDETRLIRFDNAFYRLCRDDPGEFTIWLRSHDATTARSIKLDFQYRDLYVNRINDATFVRYASTIDLSPSLQRSMLDVWTTNGGHLFECQSKIIFCVAESLRIDYIATRVAQSLRAQFMHLRGVSQNLNMLDLLPTARNWGQTSDAIVDCLSPRARSLLLVARSELNTNDRQFFEKVIPANLGSNLEQHGRRIRVIKRPPPTTK